MCPDDRDAACLWDILDRARRIPSYVAGRSLDQYVRDQAIQDAVERCVEVIGEAANRLSDAFRQAHPEVPWRAIIAQRHMLAHQYDAIRPERLYQVAIRHIPELIEQIEVLLAQFPDDAAP